MECIRLISALIFVNAVNCKMESFVLGGNVTSITFFPHSVYLGILCKDSFICGGSILNQLVVVTAGHCLEECKDQDKVFVQFGHEQLDRMRSTRMKRFIIHEDYDDHVMVNDIALVSVKTPIRLGAGVRRVALLATPPGNIKLAFTAGWGVTNSKSDLSKVLLSVPQEIQSPRLCHRALGKLPPGSFCAGPIKGPGAPDRGDSGSALVVYDFIQIGIVSYKVTKYSLVVYTNVSYHYSWIRRRSAWIACKDD